MSDNIKNVFPVKLTSYLALVLHVILSGRSNRIGVLPFCVGSLRFYFFILHIHKTDKLTIMALYWIIQHVF